MHFHQFKMSWSICKPDIHEPNNSRIHYGKKSEKGAKLRLPERRNFPFQVLQRLSGVTDNSDRSFH